MRHTIREVDRERGIIQITTADERFYARLINEGTRKIWVKECAGIKPLQKDYPLSLSLGELVGREKELLEVAV